MEQAAIELPNRTPVPAAPGRYRVVPAPDLNEVDEERFLLEYDFPYLFVREMATRRASEVEKLFAHHQVRAWAVRHPRILGNIGLDRSGYQFFRPLLSRARGSRRQFMPDISYVDERTWSRLSADEKTQAYLPCIPVVIIELMSQTDRIADLQAKVSKFINAGTREGVIVDTRRDRVWIYNKGQRPYFAPFGPAEFDSWPEFTLDCIAICDARVRSGLA